MPPRHRRARPQLLPALTTLLLLGGAPARAETVSCHVDYGGETRRVEAHPTAAPYTVPTVQIGSYFLFRLVFEERTAIKTYVYADRDGDSPLPLHQGVYSWPPAMAPRHGFTGRIFVYEPLRDGELSFWCGIAP